MSQAAPETIDRSRYRWWQGGRYAWTDRAYAWIRANRGSRRVTALMILLAVPAAIESAVLVVVRRIWPPRT